MGIAPNDASPIRLLGTLLAEQTDQWQLGRRRRRMSLEAIAGVLGRNEAAPVIEPEGA